MLLRLFIIVVATLAVWAPRLQAEILKLTDTEGRVLEAEVVDFNGRYLKIRREDGREFNLAPDKLSPKSLELVNNWIANNGVTFFSPADYEHYPFEISPSTLHEKVLPTKARFSIEQVRGSKPKYLKDGEFIIIGTLISDDYEDEKLLFSAENGFDAKSQDYSRSYEPTERWSRFKLAVKTRSDGRLMLALSGRSDGAMKYRIYLGKQGN